MKNSKRITPQPQQDARKIVTHADRVFNRMRLAREGKRKFVAISIRLPEDVIDDLKDIAPTLGFSGYQPLARTYIARGLSNDLIRLDQNKNHILAQSLRKHGVSESVIAEVMKEAAVA